VTLYKWRRQDLAVAGDESGGGIDEKNPERLWVPPTSFYGGLGDCG